MFAVRKIPSFDVAEEAAVVFQSDSEIIAEFIHFLHFNEHEIDIATHYLRDGKYVIAFFGERIDPVIFQ